MLETAGNQDKQATGCFSLFIPRTNGGDEDEKGNGKHVGDDEI